MSIADNLARVRDRIAVAAARSGRRAETITLVGASKYVDVAAARALAAAGCLDLGESRPQDLWAKAATIDMPEVRWHLIGHLQRNKVARTLPLVTLVHSVDSERLLAALDKEAAAQSRRLPILLEVNISGDVSKHGFQPNEVEPALAEADQFVHLDIQGLMGMASLEGGTDVARHDFARLRELRDRLAAAIGLPLHELSMGMSGDYEIAIEEGATIVRVGSALFEGIDSNDSASH